MSQEEYIGIDVRQATISAAVINAQGKLIMECLLEPVVYTILRRAGNRRERKTPSRGSSC